MSAFAPKPCAVALCADLMRSQQSSYCADHRHADALHGAPEPVPDRRPNLIKDALALELGPALPVLLARVMEARQR